MKDEKLLSMSIIILALGIIFSSVWIGNSLEKSYALQEAISISAELNVLNLSQVAKYIGMTEEEVLGVIKSENMVLEKTKSFSGNMFPYFTINNKKYFYKNEVDKWLEDVSINRREYNTTKGWVLQ